jgi:hypothetical protein
MKIQQIMKKIILCTFILSAFAMTNLSAQKTAILKGNAWQTLSLVTFDYKFNEMMGMDMPVPKFSKAVKSLEGKEVTLQGYILPLEGKRSQKYFIFSAYPYNLCYFCGGAGPESVAEVYCKKPIKYTTKMITVKGKLRLNSTGDLDKMMYILTDVELVD